MLSTYEFPNLLKFPVTFSIIFANPETQKKLPVICIQSTVKFSSTSTPR